MVGIRLDEQQTKFAEVDLHPELYTIKIIFENINLRIVLTRFLSFTFVSMCILQYK